ncbi:MAG: hypothetical protein ABH891_06215 [Candidatus Omnitrophota bacterium]
MSKINVIISLIACSLFLSAGSIALSRQGLYCDEVFQAPASLAKSPKDAFGGFCISIGRQHFPLFNNSYIGAIKSTIYGLYLRIFKACFSVVSWRLLGVFFVSVAIFLFGWLLRKEWPPLGLVIFFVFVILDPSVLLMTRHDWGSVALILALRLLFIGVWLRGEIKGVPHVANSFWLGVIAGVALYEKLSSVVLLVPLLMFMFFSGPRRKIPHLFACAAGYFLGCFPLIPVNLYSWVHEHKLFSLSAVAHSSIRLSWSDHASYFWKYLCLGNGALVKAIICGVQTGWRLYCVEGICILLISSLIASLWVFARNSSRWFKWAGISLLAYLAIAVAIRVLPQTTWVYHWILGTPFQYVAMALTFTGLYDKGGRRTVLTKILRWLFLIVLSVFFLYRIIVFSSTERSLLTGKTSPEWSPEYTQMAEFFAQHVESAIFIAADWGFIPQIICMANGNAPVFELYVDFKGMSDLKQIIDQVIPNKVYIIFLQRVPEWRQYENTAKILSDMESLEGWQEAELDSELRGLKLIRIRKFLKKEKV